MFTWHLLQTKGEAVGYRLKLGASALFVSLLVLLVWGVSVGSASGTATYLTAFGSGSEPCPLWAPADSAADAEGNLWIADTAHNRVLEFDSEGEFVRQVGTEGSGAGEFLEPYGIASDSEGNVYVVDTGNHRVQKFDSKGKYLASFGEAGTEDGQFELPIGIAIDAEDDVWVVDPYHEPMIQQLDSEGEFISGFGSFGEEEGQFELPVAIAVNDHRKMSVDGHRKMQVGLPS